MTHIPSTDFDTYHERSPFEEALFSQESTCVDSHPDYEELRHDKLLLESSRRTSPHKNIEERVPVRIVVEQAAARYFYLVNEGVESLASTFTEEEIVLLVNTTCHPIWHWEPSRSMAAVLANEFGLSRHRVLRRKLANLTSIQDVAVVDICERVWRGSGGNTLRSEIEATGLRLAKGK